MYEICFVVQSLMFMYYVQYSMVESSSNVASEGGGDEHHRVEWQTWNLNDVSMVKTGFVLPAVFNLGPVQFW